MFLELITFIPSLLTESKTTVLSKSACVCVLYSLMTGKLSYYKVTVTDYKIVDCECKAREFSRYSPCKHMKRLHEKIGHSL